MIQLKASYKIIVRAGQTVIAMKERAHSLYLKRKTNNNNNQPIITKHF